MEQVKLKKVKMYLEQFFFFFKKKQIKSEWQESKVTSRDVKLKAKIGHQSCAGAARQKHSAAPSQTPAAARPEFHFLLTGSPGAPAQFKANLGTLDCQKLSMLSVSISDHAWYAIPRDS